jgi:hypothetical protein
MSLGELTVASTDHSERIVALEEGHKHVSETTSNLGKKLDKMQHWILGVLGTALIHLLLALLRK